MMGCADSLQYPGTHLLMITKNIGDQEFERSSGFAFLSPVLLDQNRRDVAAKVSQSLHSAWGAASPTRCS